MRIIAFTGMGKDLTVGQRSAVKSLLVALSPELLATDHPNHDIYEYAKDFRLAYEFYHDPGQMLDVAEVLIVFPSDDPDSWAVANDAITGSKVVYLINHSGQVKLL